MSGIGKSSYSINIGGNVQNSMILQNVNLRNQQEIDYVRIAEIVRECLEIVNSDLFKNKYANESNELRNELAQLCRMIESQQKPQGILGEITSIKARYASVCDGVIASGIWVGLSKVFDLISR